MATHRRAKLAFHALRNYACKIACKPSTIQQSTSRTFHSFTHNNPPNASFGLRPYLPSVTPRFGLGLGFLKVGSRITHQNPFLCGGGPRRFYYVDRYNVECFRARGPRRRFQNARTAFIVVVVAGGVVILTVYVGNLETVPYRNRRHFVLLPKELEREIGESQFDQIREAFSFQEGILFSIL